MAELTKIEYAMDGETGIQAIQNNFMALNDDAIKVGKEIAERKLTIKSPFSENDICRISRVGNIVRIIGSVNANMKKGDVCDIPQGFKPRRAIHFEASQATGDINSKARIYIDGGKMQIVAIKGTMPVWIETMYFTDDDFPD